MRFKIFALVGFTLLFISCKEVNELGPGTENPELNSKNSPGNENEILKVDMDAIIKSLQGTWKEGEYPFRVVHFKDLRVKFIEEGIVEEPRFQEYSVRKECPFNVNNIKNIRPEDLILVMMEQGTCEKLKISNDTLILRGFNVNSGRDYHMVYYKDE